MDFLLQNLYKVCFIDKNIIGDFRMPLVRAGQDTATWLSILRKGNIAYGYDEVFTLTYDVQAERLSLTVCIGDGEIRFRTFSIDDYKAEATLSSLEMIKMLEDILTEIERDDDEWWVEN